MTTTKTRRTTEIRREEVQAGDVLHSSHGFRVYVDEVRTGAYTTTIRGGLHRPGGAPWTESYPAASLVVIDERNRYRTAGSLRWAAFTGSVAEAADDLSATALDEYDRRLAADGPTETNGLATLYLVNATKGDEERAYLVIAVGFYDATDRAATEMRAHGIDTLGWTFGVAADLTILRGRDR